MTTSLNRYGAKYNYKTTKLPIFRGVNPNNGKLDDYRLNSIGTWPVFTSCTTTKDVALQFSR